MNVGDIHRFEEKLRETEQSLGVKEGTMQIYLFFYLLSTIYHSNTVT